MLNLELDDTTSGPGRSADLEAPDLEDEDDEEDDDDETDMREPGSPHQDMVEATTSPSRERSSDGRTAAG